MKTINNKQYKECSLVMLATDKAEDSLVLSNNRLWMFHGYFTQEYLHSQNKKSYHLYIISDDDINEGDWFTLNEEHSQGRIRKCWEIRNGNYYIDDPNDIKRGWGFVKPDECKKIIATTDKSLRLNSVKVSASSDFTLEQISENMPCLPQIPQSFIDHYIEQYNNGNVVDKVLVEYTQIYQNDMGVITINHTNSKTQSHWENVIDNTPKINSDNTINILTQKDSWNRDEVIELIKQYIEDVNNPIWFKKNYGSFDKWISKNL